MAQEISWDFGCGVANFFDDATKFETAGNDNDKFSLTEKQVILNAVFPHLREGHITHVKPRVGTNFLIQGWNERNSGNVIFNVFKCSEAGEPFFRVSVLSQLTLTSLTTIEEVAQALKTHLGTALPLPKPVLSVV